VMNIGQSRTNRYITAITPETHQEIDNDHAI
jgi:hypothetical protein